MLKSWYGDRFQPLFGLAARLFQQAGACCENGLPQPDSTASFHSLVVPRRGMSELWEPSGCYGAVSGHSAPTIYAGDHATTIAWRFHSQRAVLPSMLVKRTMMLPDGRSCMIRHSTQWLIYAGLRDCAAAVPAAGLPMWRRPVKMIDTHQSYRYSAHIESCEPSAPLRRAFQPSSLLWMPIALIAWRKPSCPPSRAALALPSAPACR